MIEIIMNAYFGFGGMLGLLFTAGILLYTYVRIIQLKQWKNLILVSVIIALCVISVTNTIISVLFTFVLLLNTLFYIYYIVRSFFRKKMPVFDESRELPAVSVIIPGKNESRVIEETILSISRQDYPVSKYEIILIDDGSDDNTYEIGLALASKVKNLKVVRNPVPMGKSRAINSVLREITTDYLLILDADHTIRPGFFKQALRHFITPDVACVQAKHLVRNGRDSLLARLIEIENLHRYEVLYRGKDMPVFLGSSAIFKTDILKEIGGFNDSMLTEDLELTYRLYEKGYKIIFDPTIASYEIATADFINFFKQRHRWFRGIWQSFLLHFGTMFRAKNLSAKIRINFYHLNVENLTLTSFFFCNVMFALHVLGIRESLLPYVVLFKSVILLVISTMAVVRSRRWILVPFFPLILLYYIIYAFPNILAWIDSFILKTPFIWVKTDRSRLKQGVKRPVFMNVYKPENEETM